MDALASLLGSSVPFERRDAEEAEVDRRTAYQWLREICSFSLMRAPQIVLGGPGVIVHIDESLFCHKLKVHMSIENNWGRPTTRDLGVWNGKHINLSIFRVHGGGTAARRSYTSTYHYAPHRSKHCHPFQHVGSILCQSPKCSAGSCS